MAVGDDAQHQSGNGIAYAYNGSRWSAATEIDPGEQVGTVSCASSTFCVAGDDDFNTLVFNGVSWSKRPIPSDNYIASVSCASPLFCAAVGTHAETFDGSAWSAPATILPNVETGLVAVSCPSVGVCVGIGYDGDDNTVAYTYGPAGWSSPTTVLNGGRLLSVSCPSKSFCLAIGNDDAKMTTWNGATWSTPQTVPTGADRISCASDSFCVGVNDHPADNVVIYSNGEWSTPNTVMLTDGYVMDSVSCPTANFCAAVSDTQAFTYSS